MSDWEKKMELRREQVARDRKAAEEAQRTYYRENGHREYELPPHRDCLWPTKCWCKCAPCLAAALLAGGPTSLSLARAALTELMEMTLEGAEHPFLTEGTLYPLLGKGDARTVLAFVHRLGEALGGYDE